MFSGTQQIFFSSRKLFILSPISLKINKLLGDEKLKDENCQGKIL